MSMPLRSLALACLLALSTPSFAQPVAMPKGVTAGSCVEGICEYGLGNGLRVLLFPDPSKPTVTVNLVYGVGSVHENYGETGMAHLLEHLQFKGTPRHGDITGEMKKRGIGYNASTSLDRTNYFASFPASNETLDWVLGLEADRMLNSFIAKKDLDSEMTVVRNEMERNQNSPGFQLHTRIRSAAFDWHNYGNTTIGARSDVEGVPIDRLQAFYRTWYQPDNATLIVAGRIDPAQTLALVGRHFGPLARPARTLPSMYTIEPVKDGEREVNVRRSGDIRMVGLAYSVPAATHPDTPALMVLGNILGHAPSGRLHKALVETKLAAAAGGGSEAQRDPGLLSLTAVAASDADMAKLETELLAQSERIAARPITQAELDDARQRFATGYETAFDDVNNVGMSLSEYIAAGDWRLWFVLRDAIDKVSLADVNRVAGKYLIPANRTLGRFIPTDAPVRAEPAPAPSVASLVDGYAGRAAVAAGEAFDPTPSNIEARTQRFTLSNGVQVALVPKKTRGETVVVNATFRFADEAALRGREDAVMAGAMLMTGAAGMNREQIARRFVELKTDASVSGGMQGASIHLDTKRPQLAEALTLAARILREPTFEAGEFEQLRTQMITGIQAALKEPGTVANEAMSAHFNPWPAGHPLHFRPLQQRLESTRKLEREDLVAFHRDLYGTGEGSIVLVGDFDPEQVRPLLETLFTGWTSKAPFAPIATRHAVVPARSQRLETPDKTNALLLARHNTSLKVVDADYVPMLIANHVLGGSGLKSRLADRIRQKEGLSYSVGSSVHADDSKTGQDDAGFISINAIAAPENMARLEASLRDELARLVRDGITAQELADAKSGMLTARQQGRAADANVAATIGDQLYFGRTMAFSGDIDRRIEQVTLEEVNAAIARHYRPEELSVFIAGDFAKAGAR